MAIVIEASGQAVEDASTGTYGNFTCPAGTKMLFVMVMFAQPGGARFAATGDVEFNATDLTFHHKYAQAWWNNASIFYMIDPPTGSAYALDAITAGGSYKSCAHFWALSGTNGTFGTVDEEPYANGTHDITVASATNDLVMQIIYGASNIAFQDSQTAIGAAIQEGNEEWSMGGTKAGGASTTDIDMSGNNSSSLAIAVKPAAAAASTNKFFAMF